MRSVPFVREILLHFLSTEGPAAGSGLLTRKADRQNRTSYLRIYVFAYLRDLTPVPYLTDVARIEAGVLAVMTNGSNGVPGIEKILDRVERLIRCSRVFATFPTVRRRVVSPRHG